MIKLFDKLGFYFLFAAIVILPFSFSISAVILGFMFIVTIINPCFYKNFKIPSIKETYGQVFYLSLLFFFMHVLSLIGSENTNEALLKIQIKIPFLFFPILFLYKNPYIEKNLKKTLFAFVIGSFINLTVIFIAALYRSIYTWNNKIAFYPWFTPDNFNSSFSKLLKLGTTEFTYSHLSHFFHPAYIAMYVTLSIAILFYFLKTHNFNQKFIRFGFKALIVIFSLTVILLNSRAGMLALTFIISLSLFMQIFRYKKYFSGILYSILFSALIYFALYHTRLSRNIETKNTTVKTESKKKVKKKNPRMIIWESAIAVAKNNFWWGVGTGDVKQELYEIGIIKNLRKGEFHQYDSHNQFLQSLVGLGVFGLLILILLFYFPIILAIKQQRYLLFSQLAIVGINSMFESVLERSYGILFFSLFFYLFLAYSPSAEDKLQKNI